MTGAKSWRIAAENTADLMGKFETLGITIPDRMRPKDQFAEEVYCLRRYLFPVANAGLLEFPLRVIKRDPPDFVFAWRDGRNTGLEVTKATSQGFEADLTRFHRRQRTKNYVSDPATGTMLLSELGWVGNAPETEWTAYILTAIADKLNDLVSYPVPESDLLIYDNTPLPAPDLKTVADAFRLQFEKQALSDKQARSFRRVSVIRDPWLIHDIARAPRILRYDPIWDRQPV